MRYAILDRGTTYHITNHENEDVANCLCGKFVLKMNWRNDQLHDEQPGGKRLCKSCKAALERNFLKEI